MSSTPIPRRPRERKVDPRDSVLRASILDTALELGIGSSSTVANWIFNPVEEADEDEESTLSPSLTYASTATSEESSFSSSINSRHPHLGADSPSSQSLGNSYHSFDSSNAQALYSRKEGLSPVPEVPIQPHSIQFDLRATPEPRAPSPFPPLFKHRKLRKARPDGYDSDGGYVSDSTKPDKQKKKSKKKDKGGADGHATDFESDGGHLSESSKKKKEKKSKKDKDQDKSGDGVGTDYESDGGYLSTTSLGRGKKSKTPRKGSGTSLVSGEDSDGGYLSEASAKTRRFFGFSKSPKKKKKSSDSPIREVIPPVPSLPPLPIAEMFSRSLTPSSFDTSRSATPAPSELTVTNRSSHDTVVSDNSSPTTSLESPHGLPNAFKDAESVRSPSIDVLATFGRRTAVGDPGARPKPHPLSHSSSFPSSSPIPAVPSIPLPKPKKNSSLKRTPPQISAPNTSSLAAKHTPVPLILTPPTPLSPNRRSSPPPPSITEFLTNPVVPDVLITGSFDSQAAWKPTADVPRTPSPHPSASSEYIVPSPNASPLPSPAAPQSPHTSQTLIRPHVLAFYDLPPPSPPPQGPLPTVPLELQQSRGSDDNAEHGPARSRPGTADGVSDQRRPSPLVWRTYSRPGTADSERKQSSPSPLIWTTYNRASPASAPAAQSTRSPYRSPSRSNLAPPSVTSSSLTQPPSPSTTPLFLQRVPSPQRGRESPFPTQPVLPREEISELVRRTSIVQANSRSQRIANGNGAGLSSDATGGIDREGGQRQPQPQVDVQWQPRSTSTLGTRRVSGADSLQSWVDYDDDGDLGDGPDPEHGASQQGRFEGSGARPLSSESHPDIDSVLSMLRGEQDGGVNGVSRQIGDKAEPRSTFYFDMEDEEEEAFNRYSVWSEEQRPVSILDAEKSGDAREKFVKRVEALYQKGSIPPVPPLAPAARNGRF